MNKGNHHITTDEAKSALESLAVANQITVHSMRPPLWLILLCSASLGIKTTAMGLMINDNLWNSIQWSSYILCCLCVVSWIIALRIKGITIKIADVNITHKGIISALLICALLISSRVIYLQTGSILFPCIAGILNTLTLAFSLQFGRLLNTNKKEGNNE
jgi:hypothetical protein